MTTLVRCSYVCFHFALSSCVFVVPVWEGTMAPVSICGSDSRSIILLQSNHVPQYLLPYNHFRLIIDTSHIYRINPTSQQSRTWRRLQIRSHRCATT